MRKNGAEKLKAISKREIIVLAVLFAIAAFSFFVKTADGKLHVYFLNVGQGDSILLQTPKGSQILIDGGPDSKVLQELGESIPFYDKTIDMVVSTHSDTDHLNGLLEVMERYKIKKIIESGNPCSSAQCLEWEKLKRREGAEDIFVKAGDRIEFEDGLTASVVYPFAGVGELRSSKTNENSVVLRINYGKYSFFLTGDIDKKAEEKLILSGIDLNTDFIKIAHHGSDGSSSDDFLKAVSPLAAFIEVGANNRYNHPSEEVLEMLRSESVPIYRSDVNGTVELVSDGKSYEIITQE